MLLLHGLSSNARYWDRVAGHLTGRRAAAFDQRGHGRSRSNGRSHRMHELLDDIAFVAVQLGLDRPVVVGHSWGASVALEFAAKNPELASGLIFVDGPIMGISRILSWQDVEAFMEPPFPRFATLRDAFNDKSRELGEAWAEDLEPFVEEGLVRDGDAFVSTLTPSVRHEILRDLYNSNAEKLWSTLHVPAIALIARKSNARISRSTEDGIARLREIAPSVVIKRVETPHDIPLYAPAAVAEEIVSLAAQNDLRLSHLGDELSSGVAD